MEALYAQGQEYFNSDPSTWNPNDLGEPIKGNEADSVVSYWREPANDTSIFVRSDMEFPAMNFEDAWEIMGNVEERCKWDKRWETPKILENEGNGEVKMWMAIPKPPIPGFWQRDLVVHSKVMQKTDDVVYTQATSIEHPDYPAGQGGMMEYVRLHLFFHGVKVERAGDGVKLTEVRHFDLSG